MYDKNKYVLYKSHQKLEDIINREALDPSTYFVLRRDDILGRLSLWSYVHNIRSLLEIDAFSVDKVLNQEQREHLSELANDVSFIAAQWDSSEGKIPD